MSHPAVEQARRLLRPAHRREERRFLAEGPHVVADALDAGARIDAVFVSHERAEEADIAPLVARGEAAGAYVHRIGGKDLFRLADTDTPQGLIAVVQLPNEPAAPFAQAGAWLVLDGVQDPGNVGTLLRSAEAFGVRGVMSGTGTADLWSGKVLRAAQGAHFRIALLDGDLAPRLDAFAAAGGTLWATDSDGDDLYAAPPAPPLVALALGNEARGLSDAIRARAARVLSVPQHGRADSLNVAMAGSIVLAWITHARGRA